MPTKFNPRFDELLADLRHQAADLLVPWEGDCWRFQAITHPHGHEILNGKGALTHGGRWNAAHAFPAVYGSTNGIVALEESEAIARYYGITTRKARIYVCIGFELYHVLDLTQTTMLRRLKLVAKHLKAEDWRKINADGHESLTQCVGRAAHAVGAEGLLAPSASVKRGINLAYFPRNKTAGSTVRLHDAAAIAAMFKGRK
jgi:RES domain-containing protein